MAPQAFLRIDALDVVGVGRQARRAGPQRVEDEHPREQAGRKKEDDEPRAAAAGAPHGA